MKKKALRKVLQIGATKAVTIPSVWLDDSIQFVWIEKQDSSIVIRPAEVS